jgi:3D (Asp-Asp-Asp) domain-containing protein
MKTKVILVLQILLFSIALGWLLHIIGDTVNQETEAIVQLGQDTLLVTEEEEEEIGEVRIVTATYYNPVKEQCNSEPLITASGKEINMELLEKGELKWIAVSRDLLRIYKYGDIVRITCDHDPSIDGDYEITDTMHERFENTIDLLWPVGMKGKGKWEGVQIAKVITSQ